MNDKLEIVAGGFSAHGQTGGPAFTQPSRTETGRRFRTAGGCNIPFGTRRCRAWVCHGGTQCLATRAGPGIQPGKAHPATASGLTARNRRSYKASIPSTPSASLAAAFPPQDRRAGRREPIVHCQRVSQVGVAFSDAAATRAGYSAQIPARRKPPRRTQLAADFIAGDVPACLPAVCRRHKIDDSLSRHLAQVKPDASHLVQCAEIY